ncbi:hypothetical protein DPMN_050070 [Dreissena polymorpha]|uniref:Uncharacterized protein n=1 Tax=Dreissena polymorpha TaxID=45954 RepID=A0A9D4HMQ5_DREPO|nr:hypothetical protein DPMN_050070 [Dreissena polymorpha]
MKPSDPDTIKTSLQKANNYTVLTVTVIIIWAYPEQFQDEILRLGGMHFLTSFVGSVGTIMANRGLEGLLESTFTGEEISTKCTGITNCDIGVVAQGIDRIDRT